MLKASLADLRQACSFRLLAVLLAVASGSAAAAQEAVTAPESVFVQERVTAPEPGAVSIGVLVMAHGGDAAWNETVLAAVAPLQGQLPVAVALGMADRASLQAAIAELEAAGVQRVVVVRLFVSGASFLAQTEYLLGLSDDAPHFFMDHEGPGPPDRIERHIEVAVSDSGLVDSPLVGEILSQRVAALSLDPERETVLILAHGMGRESDNESLFRAMEARAEAVRAAAPYRRVVVETLREDWEGPRSAAEARIRGLVEGAANAGERVIVVPLRVSGFGPYAKVLEGLEYESDGRGLLPHPLLVEWIRQTTARVACDAGWEMASDAIPGC